MKVGSKLTLGSLLQLRSSFPENDLAEKYAGGEPPLRSELFSAEQVRPAQCLGHEMVVKDKNCKLLYFLSLMDVNHLSHLIHVDRDLSAN